MKTTPEALQRQAEIAAKDARIALLEVLTKQLDEYAPLNDALARAEKAEARIAELEDERAAYIPREIYVTSERDKAIARAEKAEAELAEAKAALDEMRSGHATWRELIETRTDLEVAEAMIADRDWQIAELDKLDRVALFEKSIADRDGQIAALREALEKITAKYDHWSLAGGVARAALHQDKPVQP
jgi:SMC interacting uncharacterized protein involved in chromosome segregation